MDASFVSLVPLCTPEMASNGLTAGLFAGLFLAGAAGSVVHCGPMCGGFVLGQVSERMAGIPAAQLCEWRRVRAGLLFPYHLGRLTTYALLGGFAASSVAALGRLPWFAWLSAMLMTVAAAVFLYQATARLGFAGGRVAAPQFLGPRLIARLVRCVNRERAGGGYAMGLILGLLPCSFLYGAIFAAAARGDWLQGALAMVSFGLGTTPMLMLLGILGQNVSRYWRKRLVMVTPWLMVWNAAMLLGAAWIQLL